MADNKNPTAVEPILPVRLGRNGEIHYARGMRAGRWIFKSGNMAQDFGSGISTRVVNPRLPQGVKRGCSSVG